jgi:hypothetical protein
MSIPSIIALLLIVVLAGAIFFAVRRSYQNRNQLLEAGTWVTATVTQVEEREQTQQLYEFKTPVPLQQKVYVIVANWQEPSTQKQWTFESSPLSSRPQRYHPGDSIQVLVEQQNPSHYKMPVEEPISPTGM